MNRRGSRFSFRAAPSASGPPRRQRALRPATDTIFAQRTVARDRAANDAAPGGPITLPIAALLVAVTTLTAALVRRFALFEGMGIAPFRYNAIALPIIVGVLTLLVLAGRGTARGRALTILTIVAPLCSLLAIAGGERLTGMVVVVSGSIAFAALPIALEWIALQGAQSAARAAVLIAAAQIGTALGNVAQVEPTGLVTISWGIMLVIVPFGLAATRFRRQPEPDIRPSLPATQAALGSYAMLGLIAAGLAAAAAIQLLGASLPATATGDETIPWIATMTLLTALIALIAGALLADRFAKDQRGYARWFAATLALAGLVAFYATRLELAAAGHAILLARVLPFAGIGAALALIYRLTPPPARLGALIAFLAARAIGAALAARMTAGDDPEMAFHAIGYGAFGLLLAAAAVAVTMPRLARR